MSALLGGASEDTAVPQWYNMATAPPAKQKQRFLIGMACAVVAMAVAAVSLRLWQSARAKSSIGVRSRMSYFGGGALLTFSIGLFVGALAMTTVSAVCSTVPTFFLFSIWMNAWPFPNLRSSEGRLSAPPLERGGWTGGSERNRSHVGDRTLGSNSRGVTAAGARRREDDERETRVGIGGFTAKRDVRPAIVGSTIIILGVLTTILGFRQNISPIGATNLIANATSVPFILFEALCAGLIILSLNAFKNSLRGNGSSPADSTGIMLAWSFTPAWCGATATACLKAAGDVVVTHRLEGLSGLTLTVAISSSLAVLLIICQIMLTRIAAVYVHAQMYRYVALYTIIFVILGILHGSTLWHDGLSSSTLHRALFFLGTATTIWGVAVIATVGGELQTRDDPDHMPTRKCCGSITTRYICGVIDVFILPRPHSSREEARTNLLAGDDEGVPKLWGYQPYAT